MVPHYAATITGLFEEIATAASEWIGVILLSGDPALSEAFVARQARADRFAIVVAPYDTPWIRDRGPIAVREADGSIGWVLPRMVEPDRPDDDRLFETIAARPYTRSPLAIAQGNLVAGADGLALSTSRVLHENRLRQEDLAAFAPALGIRDWIVFEPFPGEPTGHADVHVRFLAPDLMAVAWHHEDRGLQRQASEIEDRVRAIRPQMRSIRVPLAHIDQHFASAVNWVQIGQHVLLPVYEAMPQALVDETRALLAGAGFVTQALVSPTLELGGSLHCLTASVFV